MSENTKLDNRTGIEIAVIGMAGRFPQAENIGKFWENLINGVESISFLSEEEINESENARRLRSNPNYVNAKGGVLENIEYFDAYFFGYTPLEAEIMDPQVRIFLECTWEALENAGYAPGYYSGLIGLYAGAANHFEWEALTRISGKSVELGEFASAILADRSLLSTNAAYRLGLKGPAVFVESACSTSLVAVHMACQAILNGECDMALAGGVSVNSVKRVGYIYTEGMIGSSDGRCRAFDSRADGCVGGSGAGVVVLKLLDDALEDRDHIHGVIKGSAVNNDGNRKSGYTAPSVEGQSEVIIAARQVAEVPAESITYVETHGTGTTLGDPIEIEALKKGFNTGRKNFCAIGSVKPNIGHLNAASGAAGFIKTVLALKHRLIPPSLHFETPNPEIDFENSPFFVNNALREWKRNGYPLRAGVSSFGIGGTNAHIVLEEAPEVPVLAGPSGGRAFQLLLLSARTKSALDTMSGNLAGYLKKNPGIDLADVSYTLNTGRTAFNFRRMAVCSDANDAVKALSASISETNHPLMSNGENIPVFFVFSGLGSQYVNMGLDLYETETVFREEMDRCFEIVEPLLGYGIKDILYPPAGGQGSSPELFHRIDFAQVLVFIFEYALSRLLIQWGITPRAMIGYSFGEITAACVAGVFSPEDALKMIVSRGKLIRSIPGGAMLSVPLPFEEVKPLIGDGVSIAIDNGLSCIASGSTEAIDALEKKMKAKGQMCMRIKTSAAIHSEMMEPILNEFEEGLKELKLDVPRVPCISNVTGTWMTGGDAKDPAYWKRHLRETVRFSDGINELLKKEHAVFIEIGPGRDISALLDRYVGNDPGKRVINLIRPPAQKVSDVFYLLNKIGILWLWGLKIDWSAFYPGERRGRIPLPSYPFERQRYWIDGDLSVWGTERVKDSTPYPVHPVPQETGEKAGQVEKAKPGGHPRPYYLPSAYVPPADQEEREIAAVWERILGIDGIGVNDNFLELGGDSLKAVTMLAAVQKKKNVNVPLAEVFNSPTIRGLSEFIKRSDEEKHAAVEPVEKKEYYALSSAQKRLYILHQMDETGITYNLPSIQVLEGPIDGSRLDDVFKRLIRRHESLRTSFQTVNEEPVQKVHREVNFEIEDLIPVGEPGETRIIKRFIQPFDLSRVPLVRVGILKTGKDRQLLMVDMHHIITDGTSVGLLVKEFMVLYAGEELSPLRLQYKDYSEWQRSRREKGAMDAQAEYWQRQFREEIPVLELPVDFVRSGVRSFEGSGLNFEINREESYRLKGLALAEGITLYMVLLAIYYIFLSKISNRQTMVVGTAVAGRSHADLDRIVGMFVNTLGLKNQPEGRKTFKEFLAEVNVKTLEAFQNQDYPFEELVEKVPVNRDPARNPLFDVMFALQNFDVTKIEIPGLKIRPVDYDVRISKFDLTLTAVEKDENLLFTFEYCTGIFKEETIRRFARYFSKVISIVIDRPGTRISGIEIIDEKEKERILNEFNDTDADYPKNKTIHRLFEEQVERTPDNTLLHGEDGFVTCKESSENADRLAGLLIEKGVRPGMIIGIMMERSVEMVVGIIGIWKAGGVYLPIDPDYPHERIDHMLKDSGTKILLSGVSKLNELSADIEAVDLNTIPTQSTQPPIPSSTPRDLAYVIYTSGSTGRPKGTLVEHRSLVNLCYWHNRYYGVTGKDRAAQYASFGFDASVWEIFPYLIKGVVIHIVSAGLKIDIKRLARYYRDNYITIGFLPTQFCLQFMEEVSELPFLRILLTGGDKLDRFVPRPYRLYNNYGPTENTVVTTVFPVESYRHNIPIGKPVDNVRVYIMSKDGLQLQPVGIPGELCISGAAMSRGYLNRPELTAEKFCRGAAPSLTTPYPLLVSAGTPGPLTPLYRTGDLARWLPDGNVEFLGRIDNQVKIRGFRIELGEIENQLLLHDAVKEAVVFQGTAASGDKYLCAYFVPLTAVEKTPGASELRAHLGGKLPAYMIPSYFVALKKMPLNPNGKIDRRALPGPEAGDISKTHTAPRDEMEKQLTDIWADVLDIRAARSVGIDDNFFDMGGHSLNATLLVARIHKAFDVKIPLMEFFTRGCIREVAGYIKEAVKETFIMIEPVEEKEYYPLSPAQKRLYVLHQMDETGIAYNIPAIQVLEGTVDKNRLEDVFKRLFQRHESLRTSFQTINEEPVQKIHREVNFKIEDPLPAGVPDVTRIIKSFIQPFDLSRVPLTRVGIVRTGKDKHLLMVDMHHIITDGTSMGLFVKEFMVLYAGKELSPLRLQYKDYSEWRRDRKEIGSLETQAEYWQRQFREEIPLLELPVDFVRPGVRSFKGDRLGFEINGEESYRLKRLALEEGTTLFMVLLAIYYIFLSKISNSQTIIIGTAVAGRGHADLDRIIGMFVNTLGLKNQPGSQISFKEFLAEVNVKTLEAFQNQDYPFEELVEKAGLNRDTGRNPLFDVMFVLQNNDIEEVKIPGLKLKPYEYQNNTSKFDLMLQAVEGEENLLFVFEYSTGLFKDASIQRFAVYFKKIVSHILERPSVKISDIEIISEAERQRVLSEFNDTASDYPRDIPVHGLFEEEAAKRPGKPAVVYEDRHLTYAELNREADWTAAHLRERGVTPGMPVGIMFETSLEMIVGLVGILKAGGAYLPINPGYPPDRIDFMLKDSGAKILLTDLPEGHRLFDRVNGRLLMRLPAAPFRRSSFSQTPNHPDIAYIIYTSGSTGRPKGVMARHRGIVRLVKNTDYIAFNETDRILQTGALEFDASTFEVWGALLNGIMLFLADKNIQLVPGNLKRTIGRDRITAMWLTSPLFNRMVQGDVEVFEGLGTLLVGGDVLSPVHINRVKRRFPRLKIINGYGPTENTTFSTTFSIEKEYSENIPIGKPIANSTAYILDTHRHLQPVGIVGELWVGGDGVSGGYMNNPELTAEKFSRGAAPSNFLTPFPLPPILTPFYRTGDRARWLPDGNIEFLGRIDGQVKIRGFRIELGEIENRLLNISGIKEAVVLPREENGGDKYLCAYIVSDKEYGRSELWEYLSVELPDYMVPSHVVRMEKIPLTHAGKVDRRALPGPGLTVDGSYTAPGDEIERKLVEIWSGILGVEKERIGIDADFFHMGGHSLKATVLVSRIHKELNINVPLTVLFKTPYIRGLAAYIRNAAKIPHVPMEPVEKKDYYPCSSAQKRLFFLFHIENIGSSYNMPNALNVKGKIDKPRFERAVRDVIERHEILRTSFHLIENEPVQRVHDDVEFEIEYHDGAADNTGGEGGEINVERFIRPFDLSRAPLLRVHLVSLAGDEHLLVYDMHHIVGDGTSSGLLADDFIRLYAGEKQPPLRIQYKDFSHWQNRLFESGEIKTQEEYWLDLFPGEIPRLNLPTDYPRPAAFSFAGDSFEFTLGGEDVLRFKQLGLDNGTTLYMNLLAAFNVLLYKYTGQDDIIVGGVIAGRRHSDLQDIIGMFVNTLAMRGRPRGDKTFLEFLKEVKENSLKAFENQDVQFEELVDKLDVERDPSRNPLFDVCFVMQNFELSRADLEKIERVEGVVFSPHAVENKISQFDLTIDAFERAGDIHFNLEYCTALFKHETPRYLARRFIKIIKETGLEPGTRLSDIDLMTEEEKRQVLMEFNDTDAGYPADKTLHELFEEQAEKSGDGIAVVGAYAGPGAWNQHVTYRDLNEKANRLARYLLIEKRVQPETRIGLMMDRSIEGAAAILGILKARGAYVPIAPSLPEERIKMMIEDAGMEIVISQASYARVLESLQWECRGFHTFLCMDRVDAYPEDTGGAGSEVEDQAKLWEYVGETASDDITGGGWISSYTGEPLSAEEMGEYGDNILKKLVPLLHKEMRVLEIGCASGLTMYRIAPKVGFYYGTDLSGVIIRKNKEKVEKEGHKNIALAVLPAHEVDKIEESDFDLVIINSVIQDFPGYNYLRQVIRKAVGLLGTTGSLFIGDVMDLDLKENLIAEMIAFKRENRDKNYKTKTDFSMDLFVPRAFFQDLRLEIPGVRGVNFSRKIYTVENELTKFRYDTFIDISKGSVEIKETGTGHKYRHGVGALGVYPPGNLKVRTGPGDLAYVIYTSGSTGRPKGVTVEHRNVVNLVRWFGNTYELKGGVNYLQLTAYSFDPGVEDMFGALLHGAVLHVGGDELIADVDGFRRYVRTCRIHIVDFIPTMLKELLGEGEKLESLRAVISGGERLEDAVKDRLVALGYSVYNHYGPTEITVDALVSKCSEGNVTLGSPIANVKCFILDRDEKLAAVGIPGELCIAGAGVARGYLNSPVLTAERFSRGAAPSLFAPFYRTGDLARWLADGNIEFLGRIDYQVKIRGYRIELEEIENRLSKHHNVKKAGVIDRLADNGENYLCAYIVFLHNDAGMDEIKQYLSGCLPPYMVPTRFVEVESIPLTPGGKIDRKALLHYDDTPGDLPPGDGAPGTPMEKRVADAWKEVLQSENIGVRQNFFEIGGNSISILKVQGKLKEILARDIPIAKLFQYPTIRDLAHYLDEAAAGAREELKLAGEIVGGKDILREKVSRGGSRLDIAVVGMAGVFPGAGDVRQFWENLKNGVESIVFFIDEELEDAGVSPRFFQDPCFVKAAGFLEGVEYFDASFFSYTPREAAIMDPQIRIFHQCVWHALEDAGYDPYSYDRRIGLYAGSSPNPNWEILSAFSGMGSGSGADWFQGGQLWDKDFLCSRVSYRLNLKGPSFSIQTACSTSLVAVHLAVQGLLDGDCEMAVAGGVTVSYPRPKGYLYQPGLVQSPDGHCRAFDVVANGTVAGNGAAVVVLKRLEDARLDRDNIHAVIKGAAINNDGFRKVSYNAPSVEGQAEVIRAARAMAGIEPESISYIEAHGTGTELGDPVEMEALKLAFNTPKRHFCGIGSVKTNIGHLDTAAGAAGLIKTILALKHRLIPPSLHFRAPNPKLDLENSPFYVVSRLTPWKTGDNQPRRAGVSSLGIGGTNAHVIVEEAPIDYIHNIGDKPPTAGGKQRLILLSARTRTGLEQVARDLVNHLEDNPHIDFPGMAYTLQVGRRAFEYRKMTVCPDIRGTVENLSSTVPGKAPAAFCPGSSRGKIVFLFPGQGSQYVDMGLGLYKTQPVFREEMDRCFEILGPLTGCNPREIVYPPNGVNNPDRLNRTEIAQPLLFAVEYALAKLLIRWGVVPGAMMGHSIGEYTAAYFAGVFSLEDALKLVAARGRSMQGMPAGAMLGVPLSEEELVPLLKEYVDISIAAVNNTSRCVVSGPHDAVDAFEAHLKEKGCDTRRIHTSHAFHSRMMDPVLREFEEEVKRVPRSKPNVPYISNLSGHWIKDREVVDPAYWSRHLRGTVRFSRGLDVLLKEEGAVFIEVGPGRALSTMVNRHEAKKDGQAAVTLLRHPGQDVPDDRFLLNGIGQLWLHGVDIHWPGLYPGEEISRISLPGYPFEKKRFWLDDGLFKKAVKMLTAFNVSPRAQAGDGEKYAVPFETGPSTGFILEEFQAPRNEFEKKIAGIWEEVLGFEQVGIFHNFFDLNGDSLSATQVISRVKDTFGVDVPLKDFFVEPTVARLAQVVKTLLVEKIKNLSPEEKKKLAGSRAQI